MSSVCVLHVTVYVAANYAALHPSVFAHITMRGTSDAVAFVADAKQMGGVTQPFPNIFDPLNFLGSAGSSNNPIRDLRRWRESEVTHGRVCMLAALGFVAQEQLINTNIRPFPFVKGTFFGP